MIELVSGGRYLHITGTDMEHPALKPVGDLLVKEDTRGWTMPTKTILALYAISGQDRGWKITA